MTGSSKSPRDDAVTFTARLDIRHRLPVIDRKAASFAADASCSRRVLNARQTQDCACDSDVSLEREQYQGEVRAVTANAGFLVRHMEYMFIK